MSRFGETSSDEAQARPLLRLALSIPPGLLVAGSLVLLIAAPFAWDAADQIDSPAWMPPVIALFVATVGLVIGGYLLREVLRRTKQSFEVFPLQLIFGTIMFLAAALFELGFSIRIGDPATYAEAVDDDGEVIIGPATFLFYSFVSTGLLFLFVWGAAWIYGMAITNQRPNRASLRPSEERDGVGELLKERR